MDSQIKAKRKIILLLAAIIILQTVIFVIIGCKKSYIHMDEAYSLGLASYKRTEIQENPDFYNTWHSGEYYGDYITLNEDEIGNYRPVYDNQVNDVHPPLYYLILRFAMGFNVGSFSKWPGIIINIITFAFVTVFMFLIAEKLLKNKPNHLYKSAVFAFVSSVTLASLSNVIYIRMYSLAALNITVITYLHLKLYDAEKRDHKLFAEIALAALIGSLTHYYYLFYLGTVFLMFAVRYIRSRRYIDLIYYFGYLAVAAILSLIIFPYSIKHLFFGYRGKGALSNLTDIKELYFGLKEYFKKIDIYVFNRLFAISVLAIITVAVYKKIKKLSLFKEENPYIKYITVPTLIYFILVAVSSPWKELRYIMPICGMIFIIIIFTLYRLSEDITADSRLTKIFAVFLALIAIMPIITFSLSKVLPITYTEPTDMYSDKKDIVETFENNKERPTFYIIAPTNVRFLDDILLFSIVDEAYVAYDFDHRTENIKTVFEGKDTSNGVFLIIGEGNDNEGILENFKEALGLSEATWIKGLNACNVYVIQ